MMIIDRFEEAAAIIESDDGFVRVERSSLPEGAREGDVVAKLDGVYVIDAQATAARRKAIRARLDRLLSRRDELE